MEPQSGGSKSRRWPSRDLHAQQSPSVGTSLSLEGTMGNVSSTLSLHGIQPRACGPRSHPCHAPLPRVLSLPTTPPSWSLAVLMDAPTQTLSFCLMASHGGPASRCRFALRGARRMHLAARCDATPSYVTLFPVPAYSGPHRPSPTNLDLVTSIFISICQPLLSRSASSGSHDR